MGNRAVIVHKWSVLEDGSLDPNGLGIYLHWNGGRDSVEGFLSYCDAKRYRTINEDELYGWAQLVKTIGNYFDDGYSIGVGKIKDLDCDNFDNGVYIIDKWEIAGRMFFNGEEQLEYPLEDMMNDIDARQPDKLGKKKIHEYVEEQNLPWF